MKDIFLHAEGSLKIERFLPRLDSEMKAEIIGMQDVPWLIMKGSVVRRNSQRLRATGDGGKTLINSNHGACGEVRTSFRQPDASIRRFRPEPFSSGHPVFERDDATPKLGCHDH
jgi:hypothetical protein